MLRWSSAGHLPPLLLRADGTVWLLDTPPERLLGTDQPARRTDHEALLGPGDTVLLYTDGLVEHRGDLDEGTAQLAAVLGRLAGVPLDELCDKLLTRLAGDPTDDDIALLALRCHREDGPRSAVRECS
jgi:serine phosphatase RsbU (regulator of sigma subunit)